MNLASNIHELAQYAARRETAFPEEEYQHRIAKVRARMEVAGIDVLLVTFPPNVCYLSGYYAFGLYNHVCLVLPLQGEPVLQVKANEIAAAVPHTWVAEIVSWRETDEEAPGYAEQITEQIAGLLADLGLLHRRIGLELRRPGLVPSIYTSIKAKLPDAELADASDLVFGVRMVKSPRELDCLRNSARISVAGMRASLAAIRPGITDNDVAKVGYETMVGAGSEFFSVQPIVTSGVRTTWGHQTFRRTPLNPGDVVFLEYGASYHRYTAPLMRTAVIGPPPPGVLRLADAVKGIVERVIDAVRPGRTCHDVATEVHSHVSEDPDIMPPRSERLGYSLGLSFPPTWAEYTTYIGEGVQQLLIPGMAFHLPIGLKVSGKYGVSLTESIAVTENGCEILTENERDLYVAPS